MKASTTRSPELARWLTLHGLADCKCTWLPEGKAGWYLYRVVEGCRYRHGTSLPPDPRVRG
jgi:hypothetical protein